MDEATSALDLTNEKQIMRKISTYCEGMTMLLITHRHGSIEHLDHVIEMKDGKIISKTSAKTYLKQMKSTDKPN
jgi:ATP-binding cassette subfamily B protein